MKTSLLLFVLVSCAGLALGANLILQGTLRDQAPETMIHKNYDAEWWKYDGWVNNPTDGNCGKANGGKGWPNSDFELPLWMYGQVRTPNAKNAHLTNGEAGLVGDCCNRSNSWTNCGRLGADRTPVYRYGANPSPLYTVKSASSFNNWFHDTEQTSEVMYNITLTPAGGRLYSYRNDFFFPLDGRGWNDTNRGDPINGNTNVWHNYAYCYEIHGRFSYQGGETFSFEGDDDVWVYLDNRLMIDLGGIHTIQTANINLDEIGLTKGNNYRFDFFYCERHTTNSKLQITTSIEIACTYYDWCDICEGDGQSCCTATEIAKCNDNNACTIDKCAVTKPPEIECQHIPVVCDDGDACTTEFCDKVKGCVRSNVTCDDSNLCTVDTCNKQTGCVFSPKDCAALGDMCNKGSCDKTKGCVFTQTVCDDSDTCTTDICDKAKGCLYNKITCNDNSKCTDDTCDKVIGCMFTPIPCDDGNKCTVEQCLNATGCSQVSLNCDDKDACTEDSCDPKTGCINKPIVCDDGDKCTTDSCDKATGCVKTPIICNDNNKCTSDTCLKASGCNYTTIPCDDDNKCTIDSCNPSSGCSYSNIICNDNNFCTTDECIPATGCKYTNITCTTTDKCKIPSCNIASGCVFSNRDCNDNNACTTDSCDPAIGCQNKPVQCDDGNVCTKDTCDKVTGCSNNIIPCNPRDACATAACDKVLGCQQTNITCNDNSYCTKDSCDPKSGCRFEEISCVDGDPCTGDTCSPTNPVPCQHPPIPCDKCLNVDCKNQFQGGDKCKPLECNPDNGKCEIVKAVICDDKSVCTNDTCIAATGTCQFTPVSCDDKNACTLDTCDATTGCKNTLKDCDDQNACTVDGCDTLVSGNCTHTPVAGGVCIDCAAAPCTWTDACKPKKCVENVCVEDAVNCDDKNLCTIDSCLTGLDGKAVCNNTAKVCDQSDVCNPQTCNLANGNCEGKKIECNDNNACTTDTCYKDLTGKQACNFTAPGCPNDTPCTPKTCDTETGQCGGVDVTCDDGNPCTIDSCGVNAQGKAECKFVAKDCPTTDKCNPQSCDVNSGACIGTPVLCNDNNNCTTDKCITSASGNATCDFKPVECDNTDMCNPQTCDLSNGKCVAEPVVCDDGNLCTKDVCIVVNGTAKCDSPLISCDGFDTKEPCTPAKCEPDKGCVADKWLCDDHNICTEDLCVGYMNCSNTLTVCDDNNSCTDDICNSTKATVAEACTYRNTTCTAPTVCQVVAGCDKVNGCVYTPLVCAEYDDWCKVPVCDELAGCVPVQRACVVDDADCYVGVCDSEKKECMTNQRPDWTTITSKKGGGVTCFVLYEKAKTAAIISGGVIAGVVVAAVVFAALAALAARKAYLFMQMRQGNMGGANNNPLYVPGQGSGVNPLYG